MSKIYAFGRLLKVSLLFIPIALWNGAFAQNPPQASFTFTWPGLTVQFTDTSIDPDGDISSWSWNFGDNTTSAEQHPLHTYAAPGTYVVTLVVADADTISEVFNIVVVQNSPGGSFGDFTEVSPPDSVFLTPPDEDFWTVSTAPADYDNDGDLDIAVIGYYVWYNLAFEERLMLMRNDGPAGDSWAFTYITIEAENLWTGASDLAWGDADGDGDPDLAVGSGGITYLFMNEAGTLTSVDAGLPGYDEDNSQAYYDLSSMSWADYDNDGDQDLLIPSVFNDTSFSYETLLMRNDSIVNGVPVFTAVDAGFAGTAHAQTMWADSDNDQDLDLLLLNMDPFGDDSFIRHYTNNGDGSFTPEDILGSLTIEHGEAQWGDYDSDGDLDILVAGNLKETSGNYTPLNLRIYRNNGTGYDTVNIIPCTTCDWYDVFAASWADYDSDGDMDILLAGSYNSGSNIEGRARIVYNNNGVYSLEGGDLPAPGASGDRGGSFSWFDIDGDGDLDYYISGQYYTPGGNGLVEAQMHLYRNDSQLANLAPSSPGGIKVLPQSENSVILSWDDATDDHTPMASITYDVELYRNGVPLDIAARLPQPGNVSAVNEWLLQGLPEGEYEYTIRAVDASYTGSVAATGQFTIGMIPVQSLPLVEKLTATAWPNPAREQVMIGFSLPSASEVNITFYDLAGNRLITVPTARYTEGNHSRMLNISALQKGIYIYKLTAGGSLIAGKVIVN